MIWYPGIASPLIACVRQECRMAAMGRKNKMFRKPLTVQGITASLGTVLLLHAVLAPSAYGQTEVCKTTPPILFPTYNDQQATSGKQVVTETAWNHNDVSYGRSQMVLGDIDGDGQDELIAFPWHSHKLEIWRWAQTTWTPMEAFPVELFGGDFPYSVQLANVVSTTKKDLVVRMDVANGSPTRWREDVYTYDPATLTWSMIQSTPTNDFSGSYYFKGGKTSTIDSRMRFTSTASTVDYLNAGVVTPQNATSINPANFANCANSLSQGYCIAFSDVNGDGGLDLVALYKDGSIHIFPQIAGKYFGGTEIIPRVRFPAVTGKEVPYTFQMGDVDGDGKDEILLVESARIQVYYYDRVANDFTPWPDAGRVQSLDGRDDLHPPYFKSVTILPKGDNSPGVVVVTPSGVKKLIYPTVNGVPNRVVLGALQNPDISGANGFNQEGYLGYFRYGKAGGGTVMLARSSAGIKTVFSPGNDGLFSSVNGYPPYSTPFPTNAQQAAVAAYAVIGRLAGVGPDIRANYANVAVPWALVQFKILNAKAPAPPSGITAALWTQAFELVRNQTLDEITAVQGTNLWFDFGNDFFTKTYLVKDAALSEITQALNLPGDPGIAAVVSGAISDALSLLGGLGGLGGTVLKLSETVAARLDKALAVIGMLTTIASTVQTYTAPSAPDVATGAYSLKTTLDHLADASRIANSCSRGSALKNWNQSKPISDGLITGLMYADAETLEDILRVGQNVYKEEVWRGLAPTKWTFTTVNEQNNVQFTGRPGYPLEYAFQGTCSGIPMSYVLVDPVNYNFPNKTALDALFKAPPDGLGANPRDVFSTRWNLPLYMPPFLHNFDFGINNPGVIDDGGCGFNFNPTSASPEAPPVSSEASEDQRTPPAVVEREVTPSANALLEKLADDVKRNFGDVEVRDRLSAILTNAGYRLQTAQKAHQAPTDAIRILDMFIVQSLNQANTDRELEKEQAQAETAAAVAVKSALLRTMRSAQTAVAQ